MCECCQFAQYVVMDEMSWKPETQSGGHEGPEPADFPAHWPLGALGEDCMWAVYDPDRGKYRKARGSPREKPEPHPEAPEMPVYGPV